jgi:hypothetical protein
MTENVKHVEVLRYAIVNVLYEEATGGASEGAIIRTADRIVAEIDRLQREAAGDGEAVAEVVNYGCAPEIVTGLAWRKGVHPTDMEIGTKLYTAPRPTGTEDGEGWRTCRCGVGSIHYQKDCATPASAEPGCVIRLGADDWNPYELLDIARLHVPANDLLLDRIKECLRQQRTVQSSSDARGGGEALTKLKALAEEWRIQAFELGTGHDMCANRNTMCRFIALIDQLHPTPAALDAELWLLVDDALETMELSGMHAEHSYQALRNSDFYTDGMNRADAAYAARATTGGNGNG